MLATKTFGTTSTWHFRIEQSCHASAKICVVPICSTQSRQGTRALKIAGHPRRNLDHFASKWFAVTSKVACMAESRINSPAACTLLHAACKGNMVICLLHKEGGSLHFSFPGDIALASLRSIGIRDRVMSKSARLPSKPKATCL